MDLMWIAQLLPYDPEFHGGVKEHVLHLSRELVSQHGAAALVGTFHAAGDLGDIAEFARMLVGHLRHWRRLGQHAVTA